MSTSGPVWDPRVARAIRHVERSLGDPGVDLGLEAIAAVAAMSPYHFHRLFRSLVGEPLQAWVRRLRLERAAALLVHSGWPIARVGLAAGYETQAAFTRAFTRQFGLPPARFRARSGGTPWLLPPGERSRRVQSGVTVVAQPERALACFRHVGDLGALARRLPPLIEVAGSLGWLGPEVWTVLVFHDESRVVEPAHWRIDVGWPVPDGTTLPEGFSRVVLPAGDYATCTAAGTSAELDETFSRFLYEEVPASGLQPAAFESVLEVHGSHAWDVIADPSDSAVRPMVARVLHQVGRAGALLQG
jgi:AraC family transcriptional regulator